MKLKLSDKKIAVFGSTGSVGRQIIEVARYHNVRIEAIAASVNIDMLEAQAREFKPRYCAVKDIKLAEELKFRLKDTPVKVLGGSDELEELAYICKADIFFNSVMGISGLKPALAAIKSKKDIATANKESIVAAGELIMNEAENNNVKIIPVDSEHSAIFQSIEPDNKSKIKRLLLTCSGGPFFGRKRNELVNITPEEALKHPNWKMGAKITVDCSTLMNKGLEVIEAVRLFKVSPEQVEVLIHRESVIHSMVEYIDNTVIAQLSRPDMRLCIQYALTYPERYESLTGQIDFFKLKNLSFYAPDTETFSLLPLAYDAVKTGGILPLVFNNANEYAVERFLSGKIKYTGIFDIVAEMVKKYAAENITGRQITLKDIEGYEEKIRFDLFELTKGCI